MRKAEEWKKRVSFEEECLEKERVFEEWFKLNHAAGGKGGERPLCAQLDWEHLWDGAGWNSAECHNAY